MSLLPPPAAPPAPATALARALPPVYAAAALRLAFPLLLLPVMALRLGPEEFGRLSLLLVWAGLLSILVEGGFLAAATRLAVNADAGARLALARQVFSARCVLSAAAALLAVAVVAWVAPGPDLAEQAAAAALLGALACALGWPATWYLQASGQLHRWARVELVVHGLWLGLALALAHSAQAYLLLNLAAALALGAAGWWWLWRDLAPAAGRQPLWAAAAVRPGLRLGGGMLPVTLAGAAYSFALPAVASAQLARSELGLYYLADRMVRAVLAAGDPVLQLVYPRIVGRFAQGARAAWGYAARWAAAGAVAGALLLAAGVLAWPWAQGWLAGGARGAAIDSERLATVMLTLGLLLPLLLGWKFLGSAMLGSGRFDAAYRGCVLAGGVAGVTLAAAFADRGAEALAGVAVAAELIVIATALAGMAWTARRGAAG